MTLSARAVESLLRAALPAGDERFEYRLAPDDASVVDTEDGGVRAHVRLVVFEPDGTRAVRDVKAQEVYLLSAPQRQDAERAPAFLRGWARAIPYIAARRFGGDLDTLMPHDFYYPEALDEPGAGDEASFARGSSPKPTSRVGSKRATILIRADDLAARRFDQV